MMATPSLLNQLDIESLKEKVKHSKPFPNFCLDNFLEENFAREVLLSFPDVEQSSKNGVLFDAVNERKKIQIVNPKLFSEPLQRLNNILSSKEFLEFISFVMAIPNLVADPSLMGGGIHQTKSQGHLDVHIDFNYIKSRKLHRRLNILIYFNENWKTEWGGEIELWDENVKVRQSAFLPIFNRCVVFETNDKSFHGVTAVTCPANVVRQSFAAYYYTYEPPKHWKGKFHSTIFRARPGEKWKGLVSMPLEKLLKFGKRVINYGLRRISGGRVQI